MQRILTPLFLFALMAAGIIARAQDFTLKDGGFGICHFPAAALADLDNDGDLDVFYTGQDDNGIPLKGVWRNDGGNFTPFYPDIPGLGHAACAFGDADNDGFADLAVMGYDGQANQTRVYLNNGAFGFTDIGAGFPGLSDGSLAWGDYNHDGFADLLVSGLDNDGYPVTRLYRNDAGNGFVNSGSTISNLYQSSVSWRDFDGDIDLDFAICGKDSSGLAKTFVYIQTDEGFMKMYAGIDGLSGGQLSWGDYNDDGFADLLVSGSDDNGVSQTIVLKNNAGISFTALPGPFDGVSEGSAFWADMDNDGKLDFLIAGRYQEGGGPSPTPDQPFLMIYKNNGGDNFSGLPANLTPPAMNSIAVGDVDNDSDLDLLMAGSFDSPIGSDTDRVYIFSNNTSNTNAPPAAPVNLTFEGSSGGAMFFEWTGSPDDKTQLSGLGYNLRLGSEVNNMDALSALSDLSDGYRRIAQYGNAGPLTSLSLTAIPFGEYYASVQSVDHSFAGSPFSDDLYIFFAPTATFEVDDTVCVNDPINVIYTGNASDTANYDWDFDGAQYWPSSGQGPYVVIWSSPGLKTVSLTVTESGMSSGLFSRDVLVVDSVPAAGIIEGETEFCQGNEVAEYFVLPVSGADNYIWELDPPGAGTFSGDEYIVEVFWDPAFSGTAFLSVSGNNVCGPGPSSPSLEINVLPLPGKPDTPDGPADLCRNPQNTSYTTSEDSTAIWYIWELYPETAGVLESIGNQATINWVNTFSGEAKLLVHAQNDCGDGPASDTLYIIVEEPPAVNAGPDQFIEYPSYAQLDGSASGGSGEYEYLWSPAELLDDPTLPNPQTLILDTTQVFTLSVTDLLSGCTGSDDIIVTVTGGPLRVTASASSDTTCPGAEDTLRALIYGGKPPYIYNWSSRPEGYSATIAEPLAYPDTTTTYIIEVIDSNLLIAYDSVTVFVEPLPGESNGIEGADAVCAGDAGVIYLVDPVPGAKYYQWILPPGVFGSSTASSISLNFSDQLAAGDVTIKVRPFNDCGAGPASELVVEILGEPEEPSGIFGPDSVCTTTDTIVMFQVLEPLDELSYEWRFLPADSGEIVGSGPQGEAHFIRNWEGEAYIRVRAVNDCGFSDWTAPFPVIAFTCVGIDEVLQENTELILYPNPAREVVNIRFREPLQNQGGTLMVFDIYGRVLYARTTGSAEHIIRISTADLPEGMYIVRFAREEGKVATAKFLVSR